MKFVIALDSFKGSVGSVEAGEAVRRGILRALPEAETVVLPVADGGEGTAAALIAGLRGERVSLTVTGPLGEPVEASYGLVGKTAVIEAAEACGLPKVPAESRNPLNTTTYGVGELIRDALDRGCRDFVVGIGGSATNDGGLGLISALGGRFFTADGSPAGIYGRDLETVAAAETAALDARLAASRIRVACDVTNPLCGAEGASAVFGPQKGADAATVRRLDAALARYAALIAAATGRDYAAEPGAGAAGGLGFALRALCGAELEPGVDIVLEAVGLDAALRGADFAVTGEGRMDAQTAMGKAPSGVARRAKARGVPVLALCGAASEDAAACNAAGIDAIFPILRAPLPLEAAMERETTLANLAFTAEQAARLIRAVLHK